MPTKKIYLFRHGQTTFNRDKRFTGWIDAKLTSLGKKQARILGKKLKNKKFQIAFYTHLSRSKDTLKPILKYHPECVKLIKDDRIIERSYGKLQGLHHKTFIKKMGEKVYNLQIEGDAIENIDNPKLKKEVQHSLGKQEFDAIHRGYAIKPPKGESFADVEKRVRSFIKDLKKLMKKEKVSVAISAHGNSIRLFRKIMENLSIATTENISVPYDKYYEYTVKV
jgi:2,3-bisphosphoglycerate-dependent phosphoglycerate mutase